MSPLAAIATAALLRAVPALSSEPSIALAVLFSGGTFMFAACIHVLPSVGDVAGAQLAVLVAGMTVPLFLSSLLPHHHH
jgi:zinc transporter 9